MIEEFCSHDLSLAPIENDLETEVMFYRGVRYVNRLQYGDSVSVEEIGEKVGGSSQLSGSEQSVTLSTHTPGQLKNLTWKVAPSAGELKASQVRVKPYVAGLNFRDVMYATGMLPDEALENGFSGATLGMEFSGVVLDAGSAVSNFKVGDEVMGFAPGCFSNSVVTEASALAIKSPAWSFASASTIPTVFFTAYYALHYLAKLKAGERVLIHGGAVVVWAWPQYKLPKR